MAVLSWSVTGSLARSQARWLGWRSSTTPRQATQNLERYNLDENAAKVTNDFLRENPAVNREAQKVHVHELTPVR